MDRNFILTLGAVDSESPSWRERKAICDGPEREAPRSCAGSTACGGHPWRWPERTESACRPGSDVDLNPGGHTLTGDGTVGSDGDLGTVQKVPCMARTGRRMQR